MGNTQKSRKKEFDELVASLQQEILADATRQYSKAVLDHFNHPRNVGVIPRAKVYGMVTGPCGDTMEIFLTIKGETIQKAVFNTDGCIATIACGSMVTESVKGLTVAEAMKLSAHQVIRKLNGLPDSDKHCALLTVNALYTALGRHYLLKM